jgi:hypothetical protein
MTMSDILAEEASRYDRAPEGRLPGLFAIKKDKIRILGPALATI